jgi:hypothetical protein
MSSSVSADVYDYDQQVRDLTSSDPAIKQAAIARLNEHMDGIMADVRSKPSDSPDIIEYVVVERTVKVTSWIPKDTYRNLAADGGGQMTDQQILDYERDMPDEDAFQSIIEAVSVAEPSRIEQTCRVEFTVGGPDKSSV